MALVMPPVNATTARLVEVFGEERWREVDEALFTATRAVIDWSEALKPPASTAHDGREVARLPEAA